MIRKEFAFNLYKTNFYGCYFQPEEVKAVVVLIHGMGEHSQRYENYVIPALNKHAFAVVTFDQFGHGKTEGKRGHNPHFDAVLDCVDFILKKAKKLFSDKPTFLYGHSMGGNIVMNYCMKRICFIDGIIATSPFLKLAFDPPGWKLTMGRFLSKFFPSITMDSDLEVEAISRDGEEVIKYKNDPLIHSRISPNYSIVFIESGNWALENSDRLRVPILIMHGTGDRITSWKASEEFAMNSKNHVELKLFNGAYHELHNELNKNEVLDKMTDWIDKKIT